jgi:hypothetical protein
MNEVPSRSDVAWDIALPLAILVGGLLLVAVLWAFWMAYKDIYRSGPQHDDYTRQRHADAMRALGRTEDWDG